MLYCVSVTICVGIKIDTDYLLAADSRVSAGTIRYPETRKMQTVGGLHVAAAGDLGQIQRAVRVLADDTSTIDEFVTGLEEAEIADTEWIVVGSEGLYHISDCTDPGHDPRYAWSVIPEGRWVVIGSGGHYCQGYLDASQQPTVLTEASRLVRRAMGACAKRYTCVGAPFVGKYIYGP